MFQFPALEENLTWLQTVPLEQWRWLAIAAAAIALAAYVGRLRDPRYMERVVARKLEREKVADILSAALQDACHNGKISKDAWHRYNKKVARFFGLPDMQPKKKRASVAVLIAASRRRLDNMGVNIKDGLTKMRRVRTTKQDRVRASTIKYKV